MAVFAVIDKHFRSTGRVGQRRYNTEASALAAAKRMVENGEEKSGELYVVRCTKKVTPPPSSRTQVETL